MNKFGLLSTEDLSEVLENFLIPHWSPSALATFIRNEKAFEKTYIFQEYSKMNSVASICGSAYHYVLSKFFQNYRDTGERMSFDTMATIGHNSLDRIGADEYKPQKGKTVDVLYFDCLKIINNGIKNFLAEFDSYEEEIQEIILVETPLVEFVTINNIDIPLPLKVKMDVFFIDKKGFLCAFDHKLKRAYTPEKDAFLRYSNLAIAYALAGDVWIKKQTEILKKYPKAKQGIKRFLFYENKYTQNRDNSRQIKQIPVDIEKNGQLLEQMLFENVWKVCQAVQDPDHVYSINPNDYMEDSAEMMNFWVKTHVEGLEGFPKLKPHQLKILKRKKKLIRRAALTGIPRSVIKSFSTPKDFVSLTPEDMEKLSIEERIEHRLKTLNYPVKVEHIVRGYSCDMYLLQIAAVLKTSTIYGYRMDIANVVGVPDVRISPNLVPYEGGAYVSIEINRKTTKPLILDDNEISRGNQFPIGKTNFGDTISWSIDNPSTPHLMIAGASGSGKSVSIRTILHVAEKKGIKVCILDPKYEFLDLKEKGYEVLNELNDIEDFMKKTVEDMDKIFKRYGARGHSRKKRLIIFDEAADCFTRQSRDLVEPEDYDDFDEVELREFKKEKRQFKTLEENTLILAQKARSAGIHIVLAAQRFSVKVLSGDAKANFSTRLCMTVSSGVDSRVMIDQEGAENLNGKGDALITSPEHSDPVRIQSFCTEDILK